MPCRSARTPLKIFSTLWRFETRSCRGQLETRSCRGQLDTRFCRERWSRDERLSGWDSLPRNLRIEVLWKRAVPTTTTA
ncbi:hypothetical protein DY000_02033926 [Brassica cretica]|uniref:Uncharacterized protein n=1 Tax=Brassica cretica TaxID=69181 RepID=A0ABQ7DBZ0_BRACR|nr:hypothetical protein DY000_02033926 [Brassica cretica]